MRRFPRNPETCSRVSVTRAGCEEGDEVVCYRDWTRGCADANGTIRVEAANGSCMRCASASASVSTDSDLSRSHSVFAREASAHLCRGLGVGAQARNPDI